MIRTARVNASKSYDVTIANGWIDTAGDRLRKAVGGQSAMLVADSVVAALHGERLRRALEAGGYRVARHVFPAGESSKTMETCHSILERLAAEKFNRTDLVAALGGGVTGDVAGFAAAAYMRGIKLAQIPTTLLAAVDSSVGGKTAVNLSSGKNLAGAFYQPDAVLCDTDLLATMPEEGWRNGAAEVIKYGVIADRELFDSLDAPLSSRLEEIIYRCVCIKRDVVQDDEYERGGRKRLNFGHTVGHAIESLSQYGVSHGRAVAAGMAAATRMAVHMRLCESECLHRLCAMLERHDLPTSAPYSATDIAHACLSDKKRETGGITMVFPAAIGQCVLRNIPIGELESLLARG